MRGVRLARLPGPLLFLCAVGGYLLLAQFSIWLNDPVNLGAGFWPAAGFSLGFLVLVEPHRWIWVLAGVAAAEFGGDLARGYPVDASMRWTAGNCIEPLIGALLLRRWGNPTGSLVPVPQLRRFLAAAVVAGPLVGSSVGSLGGVVGLGHGELWETWPKFFVGDALGVLVVAPMLLCWREHRIARGLVETTALGAALLGSSLLAFHTWDGVWHVAFPYLVIPPLAWAALRHGYRGAAVGVFIVTQIANWSTAVGDGPFASVGAPTGQAITMLQLFLLIVAVSTFLLAALVEDLVDRNEVERHLERLAMTDPLTGLPNRASLTSSLAAAGARSEGIGAFACDLDHFKVINDGLGHHAGDEVLVEVARRMRACVRPGDLVARLGGDEFVVVMDGAGNDLEGFARRLIAAVGAPMTLEGGTG